MLRLIALASICTKPTTWNTCAYKSFNIVLTKFVTSVSLVCNKNVSFLKQFTNELIEKSMLRCWQHCFHLFFTRDSSTKRSQPKIQFNDMIRWNNPLTDEQHLNICLRHKIHKVCYICSLHIFCLGCKTISCRAAHRLIVLHPKQNI